MLTFLVSFYNQIIDIYIIISELIYGDIIFHDTKSGFHDIHKPGVFSVTQLQRDGAASVDTMPIFAQKLISA